MIRLCVTGSVEKGTKRYLIKWSGQPIYQATWEPISALLYHEGISNPALDEYNSLGPEEKQALRRKYLKSRDDRVKIKKKLPITLHTLKTELVGPVMFGRGRAKVEEGLLLRSNLRDEFLEGHVRGTSIGNALGEIYKVIIHLTKDLSDIREWRCSSEGCRYLDPRIKCKHVSAVLYAHCKI